MESRRCSMSANVNLCNQKRRHPEPAAHLCDIVPHAPCLLVRMLRIFCFSWLAVTWSLCLAALMRWSHIFSSSLRSAAYWAQLDWRRIKVRYNAGVLKEDDQIWLLETKKEFNSSLVLIFWNLKEKHPTLHILNLCLPAILTVSH